MQNRLLAAVVAALVPAVAWAECYPFEVHASIEENQWSVIWQNDESYAISEMYQNVKLPLYPQAPVTPQLLYFDRPITDRPNVAVLRYYAGSPGTSVLVPIVEQVVFDLADAGKEVLRGAYIENCDRVDWDWTQETVAVGDPGMGYQKSTLP